MMAIQQMNEKKVMAIKRSWPMKMTWAKINDVIQPKGNEKPYSAIDQPMTKSAKPNQ